MWPQVTGAFEFVIYSDLGLGGAYSCVGTAFTDGYSDRGLPMPCPVFAPATPPASAGAQTLNTTIVNGGGTTSLTLAATATSPVTSQNVYHDESSFLTVLRERCRRFQSRSDQQPGQRIRLLHSGRDVVVQRDAADGDRVEHQPMRWNLCGGKNDFSHHSLVHHPAGLLRERGRRRPRAGIISSRKWGQDCKWRHRWERRS